MVQRNAMKAHRGKKGFQDLVKSDKEICSYLSQKQIDECFKLDYYLKNVNKIFKRVFGL
jgi:adenylosuccinate lyase